MVELELVDTWSVVEDNMDTVVVVADNNNMEAWFDSLLGGDSKNLNYFEESLDLMVPSFLSRGKKINISIIIKNYNLEKSYKLKRFSIYLPEYPCKRPIFSPTHKKLSKFPCSILSTDNKFKNSPYILFRALHICVFLNITLAFFILPIVCLSGDL